MAGYSVRKEDWTLGDSIGAWIGREPIHESNP
jgi:hypothetical protein